MRYEDASHTGAFQGQGPVANDDTDQLAAGSKSSATGNLITGEGTQSGSTGADSAAGGHITAIAGKGGEDSSFASGKLSVMGEYGRLSVDADGNYVYQANKGVENVRDRFTYTLADNNGASDTASLIVEIGKTPFAVKADAQQIVVGPDGVVTLPAGVELSDVHIVGRNLVVDMPDGTQLIIIDGAVFVPQLVLNGVEVPATNVAALLIGQEVQPAAGETPPSSGGNFAVPPPPLDPGVPLGDLIPPTEYTYKPPEPQEVDDIQDKDPEAGTATALLDDDAQQGGNPLSTTGDDPGGSVATGNLPGSEGDGDLTWALPGSGTVPAGLGFTLAPQGNGDVWILQNGVHVITVHVNPANGDYTVTQIAAIDHTAGGNENNEIFVLNYTVTDEDGDTATGTLTINVDDDMPTVNVSAGPDSEVILTTDDAQTIGAASDTAVTAANFSGVFGGTSVVFGADGAGPGSSSTYALAVTGQNSGLTSHGTVINLFVVSGVVVGTTAASAGAITAGNTIFTVETTNTGVVTLTQFQQIDHAAENPSGAPFNDQFASMVDGLVTLTRSETAVDGDGDQVTGSATVNIGANLHFTDDGPSVSLSTQAEPTLIVDESNLGGNAGPTSFAGMFNFSFGADGPAASNSIQYNLGINPGSTGLVDTLTGAAVVLSLENGQVVGRAGAGGPVVLVISVDANGNVSLDQQRAVIHPNASDPNDDITFADDNLITLSATVADFDGDTGTLPAPLAIAQDFHFLDDGPNANNDVDSIVGGSGPATGNVLTGVDGPGGDANATDGVADTSGADSPATVVGLASNNVPANVDNNPAGGFVVVGQYGTLTVNADGSYSYTRTDLSPGTKQDVFTYTMKDADGDTDTATLTINITDNAPTLPDPDLVRLDDDVIPGANGNLNGPGDDDPDTVPGNVVNGQLNGSGGDGTLTYNFTGVNTLPSGFSIGAGSDADTLLINQGGTLVMTIQLNQATGAFTVTQNAPMLHPADNGGPDDNIENNFNFSIGVEVEDADGDTDPAAITINVDDDTPTIDVTAGPDSAVVLTTDDAQTIGGATDTAVTTANFGGVFGLTQSAGADGAASAATLSYALDVTGFTGGPAGVDSGLDQGGNSIFLYEISGKVVGSTSATLAGVNAGNTVFDVGVSATGVVTLTQYSQIDHPIASDPTATGGPPFADHIVSLADGLVTLTASSSITDNDGDTATDSATVNIGANLQFTDDGPNANNDTDSIIGGVGPATGNVLTGVEVAVPEDANGTDGVADSVGADSPGRITFIDNAASPGAVVPNGGFVDIVGDHGTLRIWSNGDYSYTRTDNVGGVSDVFTYTLTDADGDTDTATLTIGIEDNFPTLPDPALIRLDDDVIPGAGGNLNGPGDDDPDAVPGNVVNSALVGSGGDGPLTYNFTGVNTLPSGFSIGAGSDSDTLLINQGGTLVMTIQLNQSTGAFTVTQNAPMLHPADNGGPEDNIENNLNFSIGVEVEDADGDVEPAAITINVDDDTPTIDVTKGADAAVTLTTDDLDSIGGATDTASTSANFGGVFGLTQSVGADGGAAAVLNFVLDVTGYTGGPAGVDSGLDQGGNSIFLYEISGKVVGSTSATLAGVNAGNTVFDVGVTSPGGVVTLTQYSQIDHPIAGDPTATGSPFADHVISMADGLVTLTASASLTDNDGDNVTDSEVVNIGANLRFTDDGPDVAASLTGTQIRIDETQGVVAAGGEVDPAGGDLGSVTMSLASLVNVTSPHTSADTPQTNVYSLALSSQGVDSGLDVSSNNASIFLYNMGGGVIAGSTSATLGGVNAGNTAFTISINSSTGAVTMTQFLAIEHSNTASVDEDSLGIAAGALNLVVTATDFDGDTDVASVDIGSVVRFEDDGPSLGTIQAGTANNNPAAAHSFGSLHFASGVDTPADVTNITTGSLAGITSGGKTLVVNFDNATNVLTAYQDNGVIGTYEPGIDTVPVFTLTVNPTGGPGGGTWDFDLIQAIDPTVTETPIGGSSSFGAGPETQGQVLDNVAGTQHLAVLSGYNTNGSFNFNNWYAGTTNPASLDAGGVNGSTAGWGVDDNNFDDPNELFVFDFGSGALLDADGDSPPPGPDADDFTPPAGVTLPDISTATFDFINYNPGDDIAYVVHFTDGTSAHGFIPDISLDGSSNADATNWKYIAPAGKFIADIQFFSGVNQDFTTQNLAPGKIDLVSVGIQSTSLDKNISFNITLSDADGDTVSGGFTMNINPLNSPSVAAAPVVLDLNGDGVHFLGADAGVSYDYGHGAVATAWAGPDDGILVRDANGNGTVDNAGEFVFGHDGLSDLQALAAQYGTTLDANDADFGKFGVWQDANSNGAVDAGEFASLTARGITSINLVSDGTSYSAAGGDVDVVGSSTYTNADGSTGVVADAAFLTGGRYVEQRELGSSSSTIAIAAAVAAAGLAANQAAAAPASDNADHADDASAASASGSVAAAASSDDSADASRSALSNETKEAANDEASSSSSSSSADEGSSHHSLDDSQASAPASSNEAAANDDQGPAAASADVNPVAPAVAMVSAEALQAAGLDGNVQHDGSVEKIIVEALGHGSGNGAVDALLDAFHGGNGGGAAIANLASAPSGAVSAWDMASNGGSTGANEMLMKVGAEMLHHDAVQPTHNG